MWGILGFADPPSRRQSFVAMNNYREHIVRVKDSDSFPMVLVGNKCDIPDDQRQVSTSEGKELAKNFKCHFFETSGSPKSQTGHTWAHTG